MNHKHKVINSIDAADLLFDAAALGDLVKLNAALATGIHVNLYYNHAGHSPLQVSVKYNQLSVAERILEARGNVLYRCPISGYSAFLMAARFASPSMLVLLMKYGSDFYDRDDCGNDGYNLALRNGNMKTALFLRGIPNEAVYLKLNHMTHSSDLPRPSSKKRIFKSQRRDYINPTDSAQVGSFRNSVKCSTSSFLISLQNAHSLPGSYALSAIPIVEEIDGFLRLVRKGVQALAYSSSGQDFFLKLLVRRCTRHEKHDL